MILDSSNAYRLRTVVPTVENFVSVTRYFCKTCIERILYCATSHVLRYNYSSKSLKCACFMRRYANFLGTFGLSRKTGSTTIGLLSRLTLLEGIPGIIFTRVLIIFMSHLHNLSAHIITKIIVSNMYLANHVHTPKKSFVRRLVVCVSYAVHSLLNLETSTFFVVISDCIVKNLVTKLFLCY